MRYVRRDDGVQLMAERYIRAAQAIYDFLWGRFGLYLGTVFLAFNLADDAITAFALGGWKFSSSVFACVDLFISAALVAIQVWAPTLWNNLVLRDRARFTYTIFALVALLTFAASAKHGFSIGALFCVLTLFDFSMLVVVIPPQKPRKKRELKPAKEPAGAAAGHA
jgi:hypothetical protein